MILITSPSSFVLRSGKGQGAEGYIEQLDQMRNGFETMHTEITTLQQDLIQQRLQSKNNHHHLIETLTNTLQARDAGMAALKRLEQYCKENKFDITGLAMYEVN